MVNDDKAKGRKKLFSRRQFLVSAGAALAAVTLAACAPKTNISSTKSETTSPTNSSSAPKYGGTLRILASPMPGGSLGWPADMAGQAGGVTQACLETLLRGDSKGNIMPWLAESYNLADDLKSITFTLQKGIRFHDGSDLNAEVVKWNVENYISAKSEPYWASADVIDDHTVRVNFTQWMNTLPTSFGDAGTMEAFIISKDSFDKKGMDWLRQNPVGTGPFKFVSSVQDTGVTYVKNPDYWKKGKPYLDRLEYVYIADPTTQKMVMQTGQVDVAITGATPGKQAADMEKLGLKVITGMGGSSGLVLDTASAGSPWADLKVREALEYAINKEEIAKAFGYGYWQAPYQIAARGTPVYDPNFTLPRKYDPEKAKQLLDEAGYSGNPRFKTSIIPLPMNIQKDVLVAVQGDLAEVGIEVELDIPDIGRWVTYMGAGTSWPKGALLYESAGIGLDAVGGLQFFFNMFGRNWLRSPELLQTYQTALTSPTPDINLIRKVTDVLTQEALLIPVAESGGSGFALQSYVMDIGFLERGSFMLYNTENAWLNK